MQFRHHQVQKQTIKQSLNTKLIHMFNIFQSSYAELVELVKKETEDNMFIEVTHSDSLTPSKPSSSSSNSQSDIIESTLTDENQNLDTFLTSQLDLLHLKPSIQKGIFCLIEALNENGFLDNYDSLSKEIMKKTGLTKKSMDSCLDILQQFEPEGIAARSLEECLLIQLSHFDLENKELNDLIKSVIRHHLSDIAEHSYQHIADSLDISKEGVIAIHEFIKTNLNPSPISGFNTGETSHYIVPSFECDFVDNKLQIKNLERSQGISISISKQYEVLLNDPNTDDKTRQYLKAKYDKAKELELHINNRHKTLDSLISFIANKQSLFFQKGPEYLIPLLQKDVASSLTITPSTVSRILCSKYCRTPYGVIPLKILCPRSFYGKTKDQFLKLIQHYLESYPTLSDNKIAMILKENNIQIARRTVAKYRHQLGLDSSYFFGRQ